MSGSLGKTYGVTHILTIMSPNLDTLDHSFAPRMSPDESSYDDLAIYGKMMFRPETPLGMIFGSEGSLPVNSDTGTFTDAPTETDFTSIVDGITKSIDIHFSVNDAHSVTFQSVSSSSSRGKKERRVVSSLRNIFIFSPSLVS